MVLLQALERLHELLLELGAGKTQWGGGLAFPGLAAHPGDDVVLVDLAAGLIPADVLQVADLQ